MYTVPKNLFFLQNVYYLLLKIKKYYPLDVKKKKKIQLFKHLRSNYNIYYWI